MTQPTPVKAQATTLERAPTGPTRGPRVVHHHNRARQLPRDILTPVEHIFTGLLVLVTIAVMWFAGYVVYRLYSDQR